MKQNLTLNFISSFILTIEDQLNFDLSFLVVVVVVVKRTFDRALDTNLDQLQVEERTQRLNKFQNIEGSKWIGILLSCTVLVDQDN